MARIGFDGGADTTPEAILSSLGELAVGLDELVPTWQTPASIWDHPSFLAST